MEIGGLLEDRDRRVFFEILFEPTQTTSWEEVAPPEALKQRKLNRNWGQLRGTLRPAYSLNLRNWLREAGIAEAHGQRHHP
jgi:hypothetical protein